MLKLFALLFFIQFPFDAFAERQFILLTSLYNEVNLERRAEYITSLTNNLTHPNIKQIHIFYDQSKDYLGSLEILAFLREQGVRITYTNKRPTYRQIFSLVNTRYVGEDVMIANADIFFDETLKLLNDFDLTNTMVALTRYDTGSDGLLEPRPSCQGGFPSIYSQDVWILSSPIKNFDDTGIALGTRFCDGYIAYKAYAAGLKVCNPCYSIVCHHLHRSALRTWSWDSQKMPTLDVPWCSIDDLIYGGPEHIAYWRP